MPETLSIGEVARATMLKIPTIRFYEEIGLLPAPDRSAGNRRRYEASDIARLIFIRRARTLGFEIADIRSMLALSGSPSSSCAEIDAITGRHLADIERRIADLGALAGELRRMLAECDHGRVAECRIIETIAEADAR